MSNSQYLTLSQAAQSLPHRPSTQTVFRWATKGCRGVKLESGRMGRRILVTPAALEKFARELAEVWEEGRPQAPADNDRKVKQTRTAAQREKAIHAAEANLRAKGLMV
jgi:hypothetical protein